MRGNVRKHVNPKMNELVCMTLLAHVINLTLLFIMPKAINNIALSKQTHTHTETDTDTHVYLCMYTNRNKHTRRDKQTTINKEEERDGSIEID